MENIVVDTMDLSTTTIAYNNVSIPSNQSVDQAASQYLAYKMALGIHNYYYPIIVPIGILGNFLSFVIMLRKRNRELSFCVYLAALAITDTLVMFSSLYIWTGLSFQGGEVGCMMVCLTFQTSTGSSIGIIFFINFDRYLATCHPFAKLEWRRRRRAVIVSIVTGITAMFSGVIIMFTSKQINDFTCAGFATGQSVTTVILVVSYLILFSVLPISAVIVLNVKIAKATKRRLQDLKYISVTVINSDENLGNSTPILQNTDFQGSVTAIDGPLQNGNGCHRDNDVRVITERGLNVVKTGNGIDQSIPVCQSGGQIEELTKSISTNTNQQDHDIDLFSLVNVMATNYKRKRSKRLCCLKTEPGKSPRRMTKSNSFFEIRSAIDQQVAKTLLLVTITFFTLVFPQFLRYFIFMFVDFQSGPGLYATYMLLYQVSQKLCATNSAINFFIYCIKGSRFRQDFLDIVREVRACKCRTKHKCDYLVDQA